jgi:hypothetical protein
MTEMEKISLSFLVFLDYFELRLFNLNLKMAQVFIPEDLRHFCLKLLIAKDYFSFCAR